MAVLRIGVLHLGLGIIVFLLACGDFSESNNRFINHWINRTAAPGETVVFHCNGSVDSGEDIIWYKEETRLFLYSPYLNQTVTNYTSRRMSVDPKHPLKLQISNIQPPDAGNYSCLPLRIQWILTIEVTKSESEHNYTPTEKLLYIVSSITGAVVICLIIFCTVWIHRKRKAESREVGNELTQGRRMDPVQSRQYFERFNSIYGQIST